MAGSSQRLKRWESPRKQGRNDKGRGGTARQRQKQKQFRTLRFKLKHNTQNTQQVEPVDRLVGDRPPNYNPSPHDPIPNRESPTTLPVFFAAFD